MDEQKVLEHLNRVFPDRIIYRETYTMKIIGPIMLREVRKLAVQEELSSKQWLLSKGFQWRETGYVEPDMRLRQTKIVGDSAASLAERIIKDYPLIGEYCLNSEEKMLLEASAQDAFQKLCSPTTRLTMADQFILTVWTVELLKTWSNDQKDDSGKGSFWYYIYLQYGFQPENSEQTMNRIYSRFREVFKSTFIHCKRFLAPEDTMRYYTTMLLHAIAPVQSIENLLNILLDFYVNELDFQYAPEDIAFRTLVKGMQERWNGKSAEDNAIRLKSDAVMSGLKTLFLERPGYMAVKCDELVRKIDLILRGKELQNNSRWDELLLDWYQKKGSTERSRWQGQKRNHRTEYVATSTDRISLQYEMENGRVGITVPRIRLPSVEDRRPILTLYQGERKIYQQELSVFGNRSSLSLTSVRTFIPLEKTRLDFSAPLQISGIITYKEELYRSGTKLHREYILFDNSGREQSVPKGDIWLFCCEGHELYFSNEDNVSLSDHPGELYSIWLDGMETITFDGAELFANEQQKGRVRLYPSQNPISGVEVLEQGKRWHIFDEPITLTLCIPEQENILQYHLMADGQRCLPAQRRRGTVFSAPEQPHVCHTVRLVDLTKSLVVLEYHYLILPGFSATLSKTRYLETEDQTSVTLSIDGAQEQLEATRLQDTDEAVFSSPASSKDFVIALPTLHCTLGDKSAFSLPKDMWFGDITKDHFLKLILPERCHGDVMLGIQPLKANSQGLYEVGNLIHAGKTSGREQSLWLSLHIPGGRQEKLLLTRIHFVPFFTEPPLNVQGQSLVWSPADCYLGPPSVSFFVEIISEQLISFQADLSNRAVCDLSNLPHGRYPYRVYQMNKGLFTGQIKQIVYEEAFTIGDKNEFRFSGAELLLTKVLYWEQETDTIESMDMRSMAGILEKMSYIGMSDPLHAGNAYPEYSATLLFETADGRRIPFNSRNRSREYEYINPVRVWIVNKHRLILVGVTKDGLNFDTKDCIILNKSPDSLMSRKEQYKRIRIPDFFDYSIRKG